MPVLFCARLNCLWAVVVLTACGDATDAVPRGPYFVASTNVEIATAFEEVSDDDLHRYLLGIPKQNGQPRFLTDILKHPEAAWITNVRVPDNPAVYGPANDRYVPVVSYVVYPSTEPAASNRYSFPYHNSRYGEFEHMLEPEEEPDIQGRRAGAKYPLIVLSHGSGAHGFYDVGHAHQLASHGYIVAVITYGDDRFGYGDERRPHRAFLRPLVTGAVVDSLLMSAAFGPSIDPNRIGISGHSFGGFTGLAMAGGKYQSHPDSFVDDRVRAVVAAAPWTGNRYDGHDVYAFGENNQTLQNVTAPVLTVFGTNDQVTPSAFILPAMTQLAGPRYVVELVDQPHVFEGGSWADRDNWELLFFKAYLKDDDEALRALRRAENMVGGGDDRQLFEYQK
ncbi:MAG: alpha/beta fold hydrolase [Pseudomonadota bacterium]